MVIGGLRGPEGMGEVMNLGPGADYKGSDWVTFEMDKVRLRTLQTMKGTRRSRGGQRGPEGARSGGGRDNIIP